MQLQTSQIFAAGFVHLFDMIHDLLSRSVLPTVTNIKTRIERLERIGGSSGEVGDPSAVIEYLREGGR